MECILTFLTLPILITHAHDHEILQSTASQSRQKLAAKLVWVLNSANGRRAYPWAHMYDGKVTVLFMNGQQVNSIVTLPKGGLYPTLAIDSEQQFPFFHQIHTSKSVY